MIHIVVIFFYFVEGNINDWIVLPLKKTRYFSYERLKELDYIQQDKRRHKKQQVSVEEDD